MRMIRPTMGMRHNKRYQPLRSISCNRRTETARLGMNVASIDITYRGPDSLAAVLNKSISANPVAIKTRKRNSEKYQYSDLRERVWKLK
jgi:hypothetical protein